MTTEGIAAKLYALYHEHMGTDLDAWRRDQETMPPGIRTSFMRCAEWVNGELDAARNPDVIRDLGDVR
jgi:hypothetical protein